mgnify:CR=1 FL=1
MTIEFYLKLSGDQVGSARTAKYLNYAALIGQNS